MAKKEKKKKVQKGNGEESESKALPILFAVLTILIWLAIFVIAIKLDFGGFGSTVLRPIFKDVPIINKILPDPTNEEILQENNYNYKNMEEAVEYIKQLETELAQYHETDNQENSTIAELQKEIDRLKVFEQNQNAFEEEKKKYYEEVVLGNGDQVKADFQQWFENMDASTASEIYRQLQEQNMRDERMQEYVATYENMKPAQAAKILIEMTGNMETVAAILNNLEAEQRGNILSAIANSDPTFAAKLAEYMAP